MQHRCIQNVKQETAIVRPRIISSAIKNSFSRSNLNMIQGEEVCSNYFFNPEKSFVTKTKTFLNDCQLPLRTLPSFQGIALTKQQKIQRMVVRSIDQKRTSLRKPPVHSRIKASPLLCEYCMTIPKAMIQLMDKILHYMGVYENVCECDKTKFSSTRRWCRILLTYRTFSPKMS